MTQALAQRGALVQGEFPLTAGEFRELAAMLHARAGIVMHEGKATLLYSRLAKRLRALRLDSFRAYCDLLASPEGEEEQERMVAALTTNVTRFFREPHHFEHLRTAVLPPLLQAAQRGGKLRIWSAACSNGPEPYSVALTILSLLPDAADHDIRILASDIDPNMVAQARDGHYPADVLAAVPQQQRQRWFEAAPGGMRAGEAMRRLVCVRELNLIGDWPMRGSFQAIFCRNVVIYFGDDTQSRIWSRFAPMLTPGGHLYIGHSERLSGPASALFDAAGITTYRRRAA